MTGTGRSEAAGRPNPTHKGGTTGVSSADVVRAYVASYRWSEDGFHVDDHVYERVMRAIERLEQGAG